MPAKTVAENFSPEELTLRSVMTRYQLLDIMRALRVNPDMPYSSLSMLVKPENERYISHDISRLVAMGLVIPFDTNFGLFRLFNLSPMGEFLIDAIDTVVGGLSDFEDFKKAKRHGLE